MSTHQLPIYTVPITVGLITEVNPRQALKKAR
jgi:hypothetical protein